MSKRGWWLGAVAVVILAPVAAAGIALAMIDPNGFKPQLIAAVQDSTGRALHLGGELRVSRSLWPTIEVTDVTLANLPGGSRPDMARAEKIEAKLSLAALLQHRVEIVQLNLVGPNILFEEVGGKPNWIFDPPEAADASSSPVPPPGTPFQLRIRNAQVTNGMVTWKLPARTKVVGIRTLSVEHHTDRGPLALAGTLVYSDNKPFSLSASAVPTGGVGDPWTTRIAFAAFDTTATATGTMTVAGPYDLQVEAKSGALDRLNALLPEMQLPAIHEAVLSAHITNGIQPGDLPALGATRLSFKDADLTDRVPGLTLGATTLTVTGSTAALAGTAQLSGQPFTVNGTFGVPLHPDGAATIPIDLKLAATPGAPASGTAAIKGNLALKTLQFAGLDAAATLDTPALAALRPSLAQGLPALTNLHVEGRLILPANLATAAFKAAKLRSGEGDLAGDGTIALGGGINLTAKLQSSRLDLDAMLDAFGIAVPSAPARSGAGGPLIPDTPLPWASLNGPAIDLTASLAAMTVQGETWKKVELGLRLKEGRLQIDPLTVALPPGPLQLSMTADSTAAAPVSLSVHGPGVPLALIAGWAGLPGPVSGTLRIEAQLRGAGHTPRQIAASLAGPLSVTAVGGQLSNAAFSQLTAASLNALGIKLPQAGETAIRCLGLVGSFDKGVGRFDTIALDTTYLQLDGQGQIDLAQETLALKLNPLAQVSGSAVSVPVVVEGPFHALNGRLDADGLDKIGFFIDGLFGGDKPRTCVDAGLVQAVPRR